jgi:hypothetical protein
VLFRIPFRGQMTPRATSLLSRELGMFLTFDVKAPFPSANQGAGVARLDHFTGLYLFPRSADDEWLLECRTYGSPSAEVAHAREEQVVLLVHVLVQVALQAVERLEQRPVGAAERELGVVTAAQLP